LLFWKHVSQGAPASGGVRRSTIEPQVKPHGVSQLEARQALSADTSGATPGSPIM
jgi:hypothetical protein